jgi:hypothetical protein
MYLVIFTNFHTVLLFNLGSNTFYAAVYAHKKYHDAVLTVNGPNFMNAELDTRDSLIHDDGDV